MYYSFNQSYYHGLSAKSRFTKVIVGVCSILLLINSYATVLADGNFGNSAIGITTTLPKTQQPLINQQLYGFDGQLQDSVSELQFLGKGYHRAYNPVTRRFMNQDSLSPFGKGGFNGYLFTNNNPIMYQDPSGHSAWDWIGLSVGILMAILTAIVPGTEEGEAGADLMIANSVKSMTRMTLIHVGDASSSTIAGVGELKNKKYFSAVGNFLIAFGGIVGTFSAQPDFFAIGQAANRVGGVQ